MSWSSFERALDELPILGPVARRVAEVLRSYRPGAVADPFVLAHSAHVTDAELLAALNLLRKHQLGEFRVAVLNTRGQVVRHFASAADVPDALRDDYGERVEIEPANMRVVFKLATRAPLEHAAVG